MNFLKNIFTKKDEPIKSYQDFWNWFLKNEKAFFKVIQEHSDIEENFFDKLSPKLNELKSGFFYLTGMQNDHTAELILTADGKVINLVFIEELVNAAPKIENWKFTALKPSMDIEDVSIEMAGYTFNEKNLFFYSNELSEYPDEIDVTILHEDLTEENRSDIINGTYIFLDNFLGELDFATNIDNLTIIGKSQAQKELVPIGKLKDFLIWRQKEFIEKYDGVRHDTENDSYSVLEAELKNGNPLFATINTDILEWDSKASHPWILDIELKYDGENNNGLPDDETAQFLNDIEDKIMEQLKDSDGYLNIGRQAAENTRNIYFACREFRKPSKVLHQFQSEYSDQIEIMYDIFKDKYWRVFNRFTNN